MLLNPPFSMSTLKEPPLYLHFLHEEHNFSLCWSEWRNFEKIFFHGAKFFSAWSDVPSFLADLQWTQFEKEEYSKRGNGVRSKKNTCLLTPPFLFTTSILLFKSLSKVVMGGHFHTALWQAGGCLLLPDLPDNPACGATTSVWLWDQPSSGSPALQSQAKSYRMVIWILYPFN